MEKTSNWTHPLHARGVRSGTINAHLRGPLTNAAIHRYALAGYYGDAAKQRAERADVIRRAKHLPSEPTPRNLAKSLLDSL